MEDKKIQAFSLTELGLRAFYTPASPLAAQEETELAYYSHRHPYYELHLLLQGSITMQAGTGRHPLDRDNFCLICPNVSHAPKSSIQGVRRCCIGFSVSDPEKPVAAFFLRQTQNAAACTGSARKLLPVLEQLLQEDLHAGFHTEMTVQLLAQLMLQLLRAIKPTSPAPTPIPEDLNTLRTVHIDNFLNNSFHLQGAQQKLAQELGLSRRQLSRVFQQLYGVGFQEKLMEIRAEAACDLLRGGLSIAQIAQQVGYSSSANFTAFFRGFLGMTPTQYRETYREY